MAQYYAFFEIFFKCYLPALWPNIGHYRRRSLTHSMLSAEFSHFRSEGHREPHNETLKLIALKLTGLEIEGGLEIDHCSEYEIIFCH